MAAIGIDLGTANCCVAAWHNGDVRIIPDELGHMTFPSWVSFGPERVEVGHAAKQRARFDPTNSVYNVLQLIGKKRKDLLHIIEKLPYKIIENEGRIKVSVSYEGKENSFFPEEILAIILVKAKQMAEKELGCRVNSAVVSCPQCFKIPQIESLKTATVIAGLENCTFPTPSSLAGLAFSKRNQYSSVSNNNSLVVFSMGSSYVEASVVRLEENDTADIKSCKVVCSASSNECGGDSLTDVLVNYIKNQLQNFPIPSNDRTAVILRKECEELKKMLSASSVARFQVSSLISTSTEEITITREVLETMCSDQFLSAIESVSEALSFSNADANPREVVLVGGSARIPKITELLRQNFNLFPNKSLNFDEAVAIGAAIKASMVSDSMDLVETMRHSIGIETEGSGIVRLLSKNQAYPIVEHIIFERPDSITVIKVYEGDNADIRGNTLIGHFTITKNSSAKIRISLSLNDSYTLSMTAADEDTSVVLTKKDNACHSFYSTDEIEFMQKRSSDICTKTRLLFERMEARNKLEEYVFSVKPNITNPEVLSACDQALDNANCNSMSAEKIELIHVNLKHLIENDQKANTSSNIVNEVVKYYNKFLCPHFLGECGCPSD